MLNLSILGDENIRLAPAFILCLLGNLILNPSKSDIACVPANYESSGATVMQNF